MAIDDEIRDEKLQYDIKIQAVEISPLSLGKTGKYEYLTGEEILPYITNNNRTSLVYTFFIRKNFWKTKKMIQEQGRKQIYAITNQTERFGPLTKKNDSNEIFEK